MFNPQRQLTFRFRYVTDIGCYTSFIDMHLHSLETNTWFWMWNVTILKERIENNFENKRKFEQWSNVFPPSLRAITVFLHLTGRFSRFRNARLLKTQLLFRIKFMFGWNCKIGIEPANRNEKSTKNIFKTINVFFDHLIILTL